MSELEERVERPRLLYEAISPFDQEIFGELYGLYAALFPLPDEREPPEAFQALALLNDRKDLQDRFGPWREFVTGIRLHPGGSLVGGNIFGVTTSPAHVAFGCKASIQDIYLFISRNARGQGVMSDARRHMEPAALAAYGFKEKGSMPPLIFLEVNNPARMSECEIAQDIASSGIDPYRRYMSWKRHGFAPLNFRYVQPALRTDASPVTYLDLFCTAGVADVIPADVLLAHLKAFVSISVLKGRPASENPEFQAMVQELRAAGGIGFVRDTSAEQQEIAAKALASRLRRA